MQGVTILGPRYPLTFIERPDRGRCLVALTDIPGGEIIELAPVQVLPPALAEQINAYGLDMMVAWAPSNARPTLAVPLGSFGLCNHSDDPTAALKIDYAHRLVRLIALRTLGNGDEITIRYRDHSRSYPAYSERREGIQSIRRPDAPTDEPCGSRQRGAPGPAACSRAGGR
jgi:hypothetical protein